MKLLPIKWTGVHDDSGYLFSLAKSLSCAVLSSPFAEFADDIVATSGFAFRMWVSADLCPSATSIWNFDGQKPWVENGGLTCDYVGRYWGQDDIEEQKRLEAIANVKKSIDDGIPAVSWDIGVPEWGLIIGYDDTAQTFTTLPINVSAYDPANPVLLPYGTLGKRDLPLLSVLTITGKSDKSPESVLHDTKKLASFHLKGGEWCDNAKGLEGYPALIRHFEEEFNPDVSRNMEYFLGTYGELKYYAWKYFAKSGESELAELYKNVYDSWAQAFQIKTKQDAGQADVRAKIAALLKSARTSEIRAVELMDA